MHKKIITAAELKRQLAADPEYQARQAAQEAQRAEASAVIAADERLLVAEIRQAGYDIESVWDLVNNAPHPFLERRFTDPYPQAYHVLVRHLAVQHRPEVREGIIRALTVRDGGALVENALFTEFQRENARSLKWILANALKVAMPYARRRRYPEIAAAYRRSRAPNQRLKLSAHGLGRIPFVRHCYNVLICELRCAHWASRRSLSATR